MRKTQELLTNLQEGNMAYDPSNYSARRELERIRKNPPVGSNNPLERRLENRRMLQQGRSGELTSAMNHISSALYPEPGSSRGIVLPEGRNRLNNFSEGRTLGMGRESAANQELMSQMKRRGGNTRTAAAFGTDSQWAWPKLHDPFEYWRERCVLPGQDITLRDGSKKIEDIQEGEFALTHMSRFREVCKTMNREYDGTIFNIKPRYHRPIRVTEGHKIWSKRNNIQQWIKSEDLTLEDLLLIPVDRTVQDQNSISIWDSEETPEGFWVKIESIQSSHYNGLVYNLSVKEDHSFTCNDIAISNCWWFDMEDPEEQQVKIRDWVRLMYVTHYLVPGLIDIYTRWPLQDIELVHKDKRLVGFYEDLFFNSMDYEDHLFNMGREFWLTGEVFSLGSWHEGIGMWDDDEIINPNDVVVARNRALRTYQYHVKIPSEIRKLIDTRDPAAEYATLVELYPDIIAWAREDNEIPVSDVLMKQQKFSTSPWSQHGTPLLLRAFRVLMLEESLNAAQDAICDRLYSPLILATLGLPDVDEDGPWIPTQAELQALRDDLGLAINSDFRLMVYHHGLKIENAFGREAMPRMDQDFIRVESRLMQVFGIGAEMLQGGRNTSGTYASGALNRELITQMLESYQINQKKFLRERMEPVSEAQEFYEYERVGGRMVPVMETVLEIDPESGEEYIREKPKLALPEVRFKTMNLRDENTERQFLFQLQQVGFPISYGSLAVNLPIDFNEEAETRKREKTDMVIAEQQYKKDLFQRLTYENLPIPPELAQEYQIYLQQYHPDKVQQSMSTMQSLAGDPAMGQPTADISGAPMTPDLLYPGNVGDGQFDMQQMQEEAKEQASAQGQGGGYAPPESYEQAGTRAKRDAIRDRNKREAAAQKEAGIPSVLDPNFKYDFDYVKPSAVLFDTRESPIERVYYGSRMKFGAPQGSEKIIKMRLPAGTKVRRNEDISHFTETAFKKQAKYALSYEDQNPNVDEADQPEPVVKENQEGLSDMDN